MAAAVCRSMHLLYVKIGSFLFSVCCDCLKQFLVFDWKMLLDIFFSCLYGIHIQRPSVFGIKTGTQYSAKTASEYSSLESLTVCGRFLTVNHRTLRTENHKTITHFVNSLCAGSNYDAWLFAMNYFTLSIFYLFIL